MAKKTKDFSGELDAIMQNMTQKPTPEAKERESKELKRGRPRNANAANQKRATFIIDTELLQELKRISYKRTGERGRNVTITEILEEAIRAYIGKQK